MDLSIYRSIFLSIYLAVYLSICLSVYLAIYLSTCLSASFKTKLFRETSAFFKVDNFKNEAILRDLFNVWTWQRQNRSNSARLLHFSKLTTSKRSNSARLPQYLNVTTANTKQFCETSSFIKVDNIKNERILPDILQKWKVECKADGLVPMRFAICPVHRTCLKYCACHEKVMPGHTKCCTCHAKSPQQTWRSEAPEISAWTS